MAKRKTRTSSTTRRARTARTRSVRPRKQTIAIIGTGYVGLVSGTCLADIGHRVICVGRETAKIRNLKKGIVPIYEPGLTELVKKNMAAKRLSFTTDLPAAVKSSNVIFIAVGTPSRPDGSADLSDIATAAQQIARSATRGKIVVTKSTVPVGIGKQIADILARNARPRVRHDIASNPEFLREGSAIRDFLKPDRVVIGVPNTRVAHVLRDIYAPIDAPLIVTDVPSAELIKYASNAFLATKISFANFLANLAERTGATIDDIIAGVGSDTRIGPQFLRAGLGWGGSCFPKDVDALMVTAQEHGVDPQLLWAARRINEMQRDRFAKKIDDVLLGTKGKTLGLWGLAFKPETDDVRDAPAITIIETLARAGAHIQAYDPEAITNAQRALGNPAGDAVTFVSDPYRAAENADALLIVTEWPAFRDADLDRVRKLLTQPIIIDGRNMFDPRAMKRKGFRYFSIGR